MSSLLKHPLNLTCHRSPALPRQAYCAKCRQGARCQQCGACAGDLAARTCLDSQDAKRLAGIKATPQRGRPVFQFLVFDPIILIVCAGDDEAVTANGEKSAAIRQKQDAVACNHRLKLGYSQRMHHPQEFRDVYDARQRFSAGNLVVCIRNNGLHHARLGVSVSKAHGNAVHRNRAKRVFRAAFRLCQNMLPPEYDYVLIPRKGSSKHTEASITQALKKIAAILRARESAAGGSR
jgi:ribonuclease P protein component